jgi:hypothetical protein
MNKDNDAVTSISKERSEKIASLKSNESKILDRANSMTIVRKMIKCGFSKSATQRTALDTAEQQALAIHGTLIGNKLKARAQKDLECLKKS